jgi:Raf kinase inhibitor-like YbhB/YbcL family protein
MNKFIIIAIILLIGAIIILGIIKIQFVTQKENINNKNFMKIESPAFQNNGMIPSKYTCDGDNINPPLNISGVPKNAKSLALIVEDPDASIGIFTHWTIWNISPSTQIIPENSSLNGTEGKTDFGDSRYGGPCPGSGTHRYFFKLYALDTILSIPSGSDKKTLESAINGHILDSAETIGLYHKK